MPPWKSERGLLLDWPTLTWQITHCVNPHQFLQSKMSLGSLKVICKSLQGNIVMLITDCLFVGLLGFICMPCLFWQYSLIFNFLFLGEGSVYKLISLDNPSLLEDNWEENKQYIREMATQQSRQDLLDEMDPVRVMHRKWLLSPSRSTYD